MGTGPSRRARAEGGRPHSIFVRFSDREIATIRSAAARSGFSAGSWLADTGMDAANRSAVPGLPHDWTAAMQGLMGLRAELMDGRRLLRNVGGNLNDVARQANAEGTIHASTSSVIGLVARTVERLDATVEMLDRIAADARVSRLRDPR